MLVDTHTLDIEESAKCRPGYVGKYCRARCIYPYFGKECEAECNCSEPMCDVATGCGAVDKGMTYLFTMKQFTFLKSFAANFNSTFF